MSQASALRLVTLSLLLLAAGCGSSRTTEDGGGADGSIEPMDGGSGDRDGGGPDERDAGPVDAGAPEPCDTPGTTETVACGACGTTTRFCSAAGVWAYGECQGEADACVPGTERESACGACGTQVERCSAACEWEPQGACTGQGECAPGTRSRSGEGCGPMETRDVECDDSCNFVPAGECVDDSCDAPGRIERVACGMCGTTERFCTAERVWSYGPCSGEGVCMPGATEPQACGACGTRMARCTTSCSWDTTGACTNEGVCSPGEVSRSTEGCPSGQTRQLTCNAACTFDAGACAVMECEPGVSETLPCGRCGQRVRTCNSSGRWEEGACTGEGVCMPGTTSSQSCGLCGTQPRRCTDTCVWQASGSCTGEITCEPPAATCISATRLRVYSGGATCSSGTCSFTSTDVQCATTCTAGACDSLDLLDGFGGVAGFGTNSVPTGDDTSSPAIDLTAIFPATGLDFYGTNHTSIFVNHNGNLSFGSMLTAFTPTFPRSTPPALIAPWFGDVDTRMAPSTSNAVFWHVDTTGRRLIATWNQVGYYNQRHELRNSFQVIITDRRDVAAGDFDVELRYAQCQWTTGNASGGVNGLGGTPASAGFDAGNAVDYYELPGSGTAAVLDLCTTSNVGVPGLWRYQFRGGRPR